MSTTAVLAVLTAAILHAAWNTIAHGISDRLVAFSLIGLASTVFGVTVTAITGRPPAAVWPYLIGSTCLHILYLAMLMLTYRLGEFSQVYPLARGTSPWLVALISITVLGLAIPTVELVGVMVVSTGLLGLVLVGGTPARHQIPGLAAAATTGALIAGYTIIPALSSALPLLANG